MSTQIISFNCILKNKAGKIISSTFNREVLNSCEGNSAILAGLAKGLQNITKGEKRLISLSAEEAYGLYEPKKVILFARKKLPRQIQIGEFVSIVGKSGAVYSYKVVQFHDDLVSLDGNHPLAGQDLIFEVEAIEARDATKEEIEESLNTTATQILH